MDKSLSQIKYNQRAFRDRLARVAVTAGGVGVIAAVVLIFFYLVYVVVPMFEGAEIELESGYTSPSAEQALYIDIEEQGSMAVLVDKAGMINFFNVADGASVHQEKVFDNGPIVAISNVKNTLLVAQGNGDAKIIRYKFDVSYPNNKRTLTPLIEYPFGEQILHVTDIGTLQRVAFQFNDSALGIVAHTVEKTLVYSAYSLNESFLTEAVELEQEGSVILSDDVDVQDMSVAPSLDRLYVAVEGNRLKEYQLTVEDEEPSSKEYAMTDSIRQLTLLLGGNSLLIGFENGEVQQWMQVRTETGRKLHLIRGFENSDVPVSAIASEKNRKGFAVGSQDGEITLNFATSHRTLERIKASDKPINLLAFSERQNHLLSLNSDNQIHVYRVENEYPEVSWDVLWGKVWYEGYDEPDYIWQSSASTNEFEPKFSLMPLSFGTLKAAFYAMLFAVPIAILGAIFTAQFMAPRMRQTVKPTIEIMEALPTVILGFLAGLWLAPLVESHLMGFFTLLLMLPVSFLVVARLWEYMPNKHIYEGWEALVLIPVIILLLVISMQLSAPLELVFFDGNLRLWLKENWGMDYDQRNSLVVGLMMGFAVIPTIFSIAEDALFSVPQHLIRGSLALGATRWQTLMRVVLPAASPGIFSALMMGLGRAVGETMIVLMATGNTPVMDMSIFQGMRTLSANIAVEVPEAEVASTHYRVLFLAALVLFMFTFVFNTIAEIVRQRLRSRYSAL